ncbi:MAG: phosphatase PAP2 family protein [Patescibacteria group bacterium]
MNIALFHFLHNFAFRYSWLDGIIWFLAEPLIYICILAAVVFICIHYKIFTSGNIITLIREKGRKIISIPLTTILGWCAATFLKFLIHSDRPYIVFQDVHSLFVESGYAFPSGHSATISALAFSIFFVNKRLGYVFFAVALLIGIARIAAGVHFPVDIIGGYILGFLIAFFVKSL